jgi:hypothetical protein
MEVWQRRYKERKQKAYEKYRDRLMKTTKPSYVSASTFKDVIHETAMRMANNYMTSLRTGERNV